MSDWSQISELFDELADADAATRARRLADLRATDPALADTLARLLAADAHRDGVLEHDAASWLAPPVPAVAPVDRSGTTIGEYRLLERIGQGGMGEVYRAERLARDFQQHVALKLLRGAGHEDLARRFALERRILARLEHPGIARLVDGGSDAAGMPFLAMEYVAGTHVIAHAQRERLPLDARLRMLIAVCEAVDYAHRRLVVHRDLKPSNVLVTADGAVKLLDFGIAKLLDDTLDAERTGTGLRAMSPAYAAPEQILGEPIVTATDVYALGLLLYELLTGERAFLRDGKPLAQLAAEVERAPTPPSQRVVPGANENAAGIAPSRLVGDLDTIVVKALAREPDRRYASAAALAEDLRRHLDGRPIAARPDTVRYRVGKFVRRHRGGVAAAVLAVTGMIVALAVALVQADSARREAARAEAAAARANVTRDFFALMLEGTDPARQAAGAELKLKDWIVAALDRVETALADAPLERAEIRAALGRTLMGLGENERAIAAFRRSIDELQAIADAAPFTVGQTHQYLATALTNTGDVAGSDAALQAALATLAPLPVTEDVRNARIGARTVMLRNANRRGAYREALAIARANRDDRAALFGDDAPQLAVDYNNLAQTLLFLGEAKEAEQALVRAGELLARDPATPASRRAFIDNGLGLAYLLQGRDRDALATLDDSADVARRTLGERHAFLAPVWRAQAQAHFYGGDLAAADASLARALALLAGLQQPVTAEDRSAQATLALAHGHWAEAREHALAARAELERRGNRNHLYDRVGAALGLALAGGGDVVAGRAATAAAIDGMARNPEASPYAHAEAAAYHARVLTLAGDAAGAATWRARSAALFARTMPADVAARRVARLAGPPPT